LLSASRNYRSTRVKCRLLPVERCQNIDRLWADTEVSVAFGKDDGVCLIDDKYSGEGETPASLGSVVVAEASVVEGNIDEDGLVISSKSLRDGVGYAEFFCDHSAGVREQRVLQGMLLEHEVVLAGGLRRDSDEDCAAFAEIAVQVSP